jgi:hypothetical protein
VQGGTIKASTDPLSGVSIAASDGADVSVAIPGAENADDAQSIANNAVVYADVAPDASIVVQATPAVADASDLIPTVGGKPDIAVDDTSTGQSDQAENPSTDNSASDDDPATVDDSSTNPSDVADAGTATDPAIDSSTSNSDNSDAVSEEDDDTSDSTPISTALPPSVGGGVRLMVIINGADAPSSYEFPLSIPEGGSISSSTDGGYEVLNSDGSVAITVLPPWARDANDNLISSSYTLDGSTLVLHVDFGSATFPVVADPTLLTNGQVALPFSDIPDSATLSQNDLVTGTVPTFSGAAGLGGIVYALAWPATSSSDTTPALSLSHQPQPVAQGYVNADGSFTLRTLRNLNLNQFVDPSSGEVTFDLYANIDGRSYHTVFSKDVGNLSSSTPNVQLSFNVPAVNSAEYSAVSVNTATKSLASALSTSRASDSCARHWKKVDGVYIYICDNRGHTIKAPTALIQAVAYEFHHLSPACEEGECDYDLNVGKAKAAWATVGQTFVSGKPTGAHRYFKARFGFRNSASATLGVGFSGSAFIGGFHIGGTKGITNAGDTQWAWSPDQAKRNYQRRAYYQLKEYWIADFDKASNTVILTNTENAYFPVVFEQSGVRTQTPSTYPKARVCEPVQSPGTEIIETRDSHTFATLNKGVTLSVTSPFADKYGPASVSMSLSSQSGADAWVYSQWKLKDNGWLCGNSTDHSLEPFYAPKIKAVHGKKLPNGAIEYYPDQQQYE